MLGCVDYSGARVIGSAHYEVTDVASNVRRNSVHKAVYGKKLKQIDWTWML